MNSSVQMDTILERLNFLRSFSERKRQAVWMSYITFFSFLWVFGWTVKLITDDQLEKLGITTVGDRARLL